jgi:hypothetical protein
MGEVDGSRGRGVAGRNAVPVTPASPWHLLLLTLPAADPRLLVPRPCASHRDTESAHAMGGAVLQCFLKFKKWRKWRHHHQTLIRASLRCLHVENDTEMRLSSIRVSLHAIARCRTVLWEMPRSQRGATFCRA